MNFDKFRYTFNSIEAIDDFGLNVNRATFRTLDPELGRWWSVDPQAAMLMSMNPYNSMNNSPIVYNDPNGDIAPLAVAAIIGAAVGGGVNLWDKWDQINSLQDGFAAFGIGALGGAATGAIGFYSGGAGFFGGAAYGAASGVSGDLVTQIGNGLYFEDAYNGRRTFFAGGLGAVIGGFTGFLTKAPVSSGEKVVREEVFDEFIDTYANSSVSGGGSTIKSSTIANKTNSSWVNTTTEEIVVSASKARAATSSLHSTHGRTLSNREFKKLVAKIKLEGIKDPIEYVIYNGKKFIVDGNNRILAARKLGIKNVPVQKVTLPHGSYRTPADLMWTRY